LEQEYQRPADPIPLVHNNLVRRFQSRHWGWWYLSIGLGFLLLAIVHELQGARLGIVALHIAIAIGFVLLGWMQFRFGR
jgi:hypothetical protein